MLNPLLNTFREFVQCPDKSSNGCYSRESHTLAVMDSIEALKSMLRSPFVSNTHSDVSKSELSEVTWKFADKRLCNNFFSCKTAVTAAATVITLLEH